LLNGMSIAAFAHGEPRLVARFVRRLRVDEGGCWVWTGGHVPDGYGCIQVDGAARGTHRVAWEMAIGPIPDGLHVLHRCDNRPCCNPEHLFLGTNADNVADKVAKGRHRSDRLERGVERYNAVLDDGAVQAIRERYARGGVRQADLAREYGVTQQMISKVIRATRWAHVRSAA
jgi:hypothetical protein